MTIPERISALREKMRAHGMTAYLVMTDDFHNSEYVGDYFKCRKFITGFSGSAGTALISMDGAWLWTDGRYFLQAEAQLKDSGVTLMKMGEDGVPELRTFIADLLGEGDVLGFDGRTVSAVAGEDYEKLLSARGASICADYDLVGEIWEDRPAMSAKPVWEISSIYTGRERNAKIRSMRKAMKDQRADYFLLASLDDIAWLLNLRGDDVACNPVILSYLVMSQSRVWWYVQEEAVSEELRRKLEQDGVTIAPYADVYKKAASLPEGRSVLLDRNAVNYAILNRIPEKVTVIDNPNPTLLPKASKNPVEVANIRKAHIRDGVAVTRFIYWLKTHVGKEEITEISAARRLEAFREAGRNYLGPSFDPIMGYADHAAIIHYSATPETNASLQPKGMLLADTGGQYLEGTTDITRTIVLGPVTDKEKEFFTRVLRGHLNLGNAKFPYGCTGRNVDYLAREPLWEIGEDYNHGTGHGVGHVLNVHEGPQRIHWKYVPDKREYAFEEGMVTSDEPGYYLAGEFGIRHENLMVCVKGPVNGSLQFMQFEPLTMVPFDLEAVVPEMMSEKERELLNRYHKMVYEKISPYLEGDEKEWLLHATRAI